MNVSRSTAQETETGDHPRRTPLTRERIIEAALSVMDREGLEAVTMRRIGRELGVEAMSLYGHDANHVTGKEDILDGICERVGPQVELVEGELRVRPERGEVARARIGQAAQ